MAAFIYIDPDDAGGCTVAIYRGARAKAQVTAFAAPAEARAFADKAMGRAGQIVDSTTMTAEQWANEKAARARVAAMLKPNNKGATP